MAIIGHMPLPSDLSDSSEKACLFAEKITAATEGVVDLLHVILNSLSSIQNMSNTINKRPILFKKDAKLQK
jgi:hypothetical protein